MAEGFSAGSATEEAFCNGRVVSELGSGTRVVFLILQMLKPTVESGADPSGPRV